MHRSTDSLYLFIMFMFILPLYDLKRNSNSSVSVMAMPSHAFKTFPVHLIYFTCQEISSSCYA